MDMKKNSWVNTNCVEKNKKKKFLELSGFINTQAFVIMDKSIDKPGLFSVGFYYIYDLYEQTSSQ